VNRAPRGIIADAIAKKAAELPRYALDPAALGGLKPSARRLSACRRNNSLSDDCEHHFRLAGIVKRFWHYGDDPPQRQSHPQ
jgi:hypothetical protein